LATDELDGTDLVGKWVLIACGTYTVKSSVVDKVLNQTARVDIQEILTLLHGGKDGRNEGGNSGTKQKGMEQESKQGS